MALTATIYKADLQLSDMDRHYYANHQLTIAQHPSETDKRMMLRLVAFAIHASDSLQFTKGLSTDDEPDLWRKSLSDEIELWVELGTPDEKRIKKACSLAHQVVVLAYNQRSASVWWEKSGNTLQRFNNLSIVFITDTIAEKLTQFCQRNMTLQASIQDGEIYLSDSKTSVTITLTSWMQSTR